MKNSLPTAPVFIVILTYRKEDKLHTDCLLRRSFEQFMVFSLFDLYVQNLVYTERSNAYEHLINLKMHSNCVTKHSSSVLLRKCHVLGGN